MRHDTPTVIVDQGASIMNPAPRIHQSRNLFPIFLGAVVISAIITGVMIYKEVNTSKVYACSEVSKSDPVDVQRLCKQLKRIYE